MLQNISIIIGLIVAIGLIVYFLLPKLNMGRYGKAYVKTALAWCGIGYIAYDKYTQNELTIVFVLIAGALVFAYVAFTAKEKNS